MESKYNMMRAYFLEKDLSGEEYSQFLNYMLNKSDAFSLVYFKYNESEKVKKTVKQLKESLKPFVIYSRIGNEWPSMITLNENNHIHKIVLYRADFNAKNVLLKVKSLFSWDYPESPMDLCFYRDGYGWFASSSHEQFSYIYTEDEQEISQLADLGINFEFHGNVDKTQLFFEPKLFLR